MRSRRTGRSRRRINSAPAVQGISVQGEQLGEQPRQQQERKQPQERPGQQQEQRGESQTLPRPRPPPRHSSQKQEEDLQQQQQSLPRIRRVARRRSANDLTVSASVVQRSSSSTLAGVDVLVSTVQCCSNLPRAPRLAPPISGPGPHTAARLCHLIDRRALSSTCLSDVAETNFLKEIQGL